MEAEAKHDFVPKERSELAFKKGDKLLILNYGDAVGWYDAEMNGQCGLVPGNYIKIEQPNWYYGRISRATAENMLYGNRKEGAFLVRLSESSPRDFSLSVKCGSAHGSQVQHFRILKNSDNRYLLWQKSFYSINELVENYRHETVSRTSDVKLSDMDSDDQFVVEAMYDFQKSDKDDENSDTELEFKKGDLITVFDRDDENWWGGCIGERTGFFPKSYVKRYQPANKFNVDHNLHP